MRTTPLPIAPAPDSRDPMWVHRFGRTERFAHWWTMLMITIALLTGLGLGDDDAGGPLLLVHVLAVVSIGVGLAVALVIGDRRMLLQSARRLFAFDQRDAAWVRARIEHPFSRDVHRDWGMFNTGQKLLAWALSISVVAVIVTGIQSWSAGGEGGNHGTAVAICMVLVGAHIFMAVVNPSTRPALRGMVFGFVRRSWAATHHAAWLRDHHG
jgi:formate dehydrogenase subunit gamma